MKIKTTIIILNLLLVTLIACGGGTSGTGTTEIYGSIRSQEDQPIIGASVTVVQTGDSTQTNQNGEFSLETKEYTTATQLEISTSTGTDLLELKDPEGENSQIEVNININQSTGKISNFKSLKVSAGIYGACDRYFENTKIIRQSNKIPLGTECTVKVWIIGDGQAVANADFRLEAQGCAGINPWKLESTGTTRETGVGQLSFNFKNDAAHCEYRIIAPYNYPNAKNKIFEIHPFTKQEYDKQNAK